MLPENLLNKQIYCLVFLGLGKFSTTIPGCLPKLKYVNVVTVSLQPSISFLGFGQVIFIKRIPKIFENAVQQLILPPHSLISVLYFSWLKDRKTKLPTLLSLWAQTNSPAMAEGQHAAVQKGFGVFRQRSFSAKCLHLMSPQGPGTCSCLPWAGIFELHLFSFEDGPWSEQEEWVAVPPLGT